MSSVHSAVEGLLLTMMSLLSRYTVFLYMIGCCFAFRARTPTTIRASTPRETQNSFEFRAKLHHQYPPKYSTMGMTYLQHHDAAALTDALNQATQVLLAATDASRGGAVVEQIPYIPTNPSEIPDFSKIVLGSAACLAAYLWAAYEFGKVIVSACIMRESRLLVASHRLHFTMVPRIYCSC